MLGPDFAVGCPSCSSIADGFNGITAHMARHDVMLWAVSRAPLEKQQMYKQSKGWTFPWASSFASDFNFDFNVSFTEQQQREGAEYHFRRDYPVMSIGSADISYVHTVAARMLQSARTSDRASERPLSFAATWSFGRPINKSGVQELAVPPCSQIRCGSTHKSRIVKAAMTPDPWRWTGGCMANRVEEPITGRVMQVLSPFSALNAQQTVTCREETHVGTVDSRHPALISCRLAAMGRMSGQGKGGSGEAPGLTHAAPASSARCRGARRHRHPGPRSRAYSMTSREPFLRLPIRVAQRGARLSELHRQLRAAIVQGRFKPGVRPPSRRALAAALGVSRNTAVASNDQLQSEGYIQTRWRRVPCLRASSPGPARARPARRGWPWSRRTPWRPMARGSRSLRQCQSQKLMAAAIVPDIGDLLGSHEPFQLSFQS